MENTGINIQELEQLRSEYAILKNRLDKQEIINDRLLMKTFKVKVKDINSVSWFTYFCGIFVIIVAPFAFHDGPLGLSWAFIAATDVMMLFCMYITWKWHHDLKDPDSGRLSVKEFTESVRTLKLRYKSWLKYSFAMVSVWLLWMVLEIYRNVDDPAIATTFTVSMLTGGIVGGIIGFSLHHRVVKRCDEILSQIEED
ncbi:MAG: hypothetical protein KBS78_03255 [Bacteroidales bacterium]|nr:hypothetical protein [Candidatus Cryptobacteroides faecihippi]